MNITSVNLSLNQRKPNFKAIKVDKLEPVLKREGVTFYNNATIMLDKPKPLFEGVKLLIDALLKNDLEKIEYVADILDVSRLNDMLKFLPKNIFGERTLYGIIGAGMNVTALELNKKEVLSLSTNLNSFESRPFEDFDLPIISIDEYKPKNITNTGWYLRKKGEPVTKSELQELANRISQRGYQLEDWRTEQACKVNGKTYLVDYECAVIPEGKHFLLGFF